MQKITHLTIKAEDINGEKLKEIYVTKKAIQQPWQYMYTILLLYKVVNQKLTSQVQLIELQKVTKKVTFN